MPSTIARKFTEAQCCVCGQGRCALCGDQCKSCAAIERSNGERGMTNYDWADLEAADILASCATEGFTTSLQRKLAKRLREIADRRVADHQAGIERAFDRVFGPEEVTAS